MNVLYALRRARDFHGAKIAIFDEDHAITYGEFHTRLVRAANALRDLGLGRGERLAFLMLNSPCYLELYYAAAMAGIVVVPINTRWNEEDVALTLRDSGAAILAVDDRFAAMKVDGAVTLGPSEYERAVAAADAEEHPGRPEPDEDDIVGLFYTSGTTGGSKGVMLTHRNLCANMKHTCWRRGAWPRWHLAARRAHVSPGRCRHPVGRPHDGTGARIPSRPSIQRCFCGASRAVSREQHRAGARHDQHGGKPPRR